MQTFIKWLPWIYVMTFVSLYRFYFGLLLLVSYISFINLTVGEIRLSVHKKINHCFRIFFTKIFRNHQRLSFYFGDYINYKGILNIAFLFLLKTKLLESHSILLLIVWSYQNVFIVHQLYVSGSFH